MIKESGEKINTQREKQKYQHAARFRFGDVWPQIQKFNCIPQLRSLSSAGLSRPGFIITLE